jgi:putative ABC transport system substrate-binding protein
MYLTYGICLARNYTVGIIEPIKHNAIDEIVSGFNEVIEKHNTNNPNKIIVKIENTQGDPNLQHAIINKMQINNYDIVAPIGQDASTQVIKDINHKTIISIASNLTKADVINKKNQIGIIHDEINSNQILDFIHKVYPKITNVLLIHSTTNKIYHEVNEFKNEGKKLNINISTAIINNLSELYPVTIQKIKNQQMIFILKDHIIVSAISTLSKIANENKIPLVTSDEGSIKGGGGFALGVKEKEIGIYSANMLLEFINNNNAPKILITKVNKLNVFINKQSLINESQDINNIITVANKLNYSIIYY